VGDGGGDWAFSWGRQEADESIAAMHAARSSLCLRCPLCSAASATLYEDVPLARYTCQPKGYLDKAETECAAGRGQECWAK